MEKEQNPKQNHEQKKFTYEELEQIVNNLHQRCNQLYAQLEEAKKVIANFNEIGLLLAILDKSEHFTIKFSEMCADKIEKTITAMMEEPEEEEEQEEEN